MFFFFFLANLDKEVIYRLGIVYWKFSEEWFDRLHSWYKLLSNTSQTYIDWDKLYQIQTQCRNIVLIKKLNPSNLYIETNYVLFL